MSVYYIWMSGYLCTGMEGIPEKAKLVATVEASSFQEACDKHFGNDDSYNRKNLSYWGCGLYDNEEDARKTFG